MYFSDFKRHRLQTLARDVSRKNSVKVIFTENTPRTDFCTIEMIDCAERKEILPGLPCSEAEAWVAMKATVCHEAAHLRFTSQKAWEEAAKDPRLANILNSLEDLRIERAISERFRGAARWIDWLNRYIIEQYRTFIYHKPPFVRFLVGSMIAVQCGEIFPVPEKRLIEKYKDLVFKAQMAATTEEALEISRQILQDPEVQDLFPAYPPKIPQMPSTNKPEKASPKAGRGKQKQSSRETEQKNDSGYEEALAAFSESEAAENLGEKSDANIPNKPEVIENNTRDSNDELDIPENFEENAAEDETPDEEKK